VLADEVQFANTATNNNSTNTQDNVRCSRHDKVNKQELFTVQNAGLLRTLKV